jgi:hypothetical protein
MTAQRRYPPGGRQTQRRRSPENAPFDGLFAG